MARRYSINCSAVTNTASVSLVTLVSTAAIRPQVYDLVISAGGVAPADNAAEYQLRRFTAAGTVTAYTPVALDSGDPAATATAGTNATIEPTYTASTTLLDIGVNMRATFRWVARERSEIVLPATAANGVGIRAAAVNSAFAVNVTELYEE